MSNRPRFINKTLSASLSMCSITLIADEYFSNPEVNRYTVDLGQQKGLLGYMCVRFSAQDLTSGHKPFET